MQRMDNLKQGVRGKICRKAMDVATKPLQRDAKSRVSRQSGLLAASMGRKVKTYRASGTTVGLVGPARGYKRSLALVLSSPGRLQGVTVDRFRDPVKYAHIIERGRKASVIRNKKALSGPLGKIGGIGRGGMRWFAGNSFILGKRVGPAAARPFLSRTWATMRGYATGLFANRVQQGIANVAAGRSP
jgi:hypothetical protein